MCTIQLTRESRFGYGARKINVYVDGVPNCAIKNGETALLPTSPGKHEISFFLGKKLLTDVVVSIEEETENFCIVFWITSSGSVEAKLTNNNIVHTIDQRKTSANGSYMLLGAVIAFLLLFLLGIRITPYIYFFPIG